MFTLNFSLSATPKENIAFDFQSYDQPSMSCTLYKENLVNMHISRSCLYNLRCDLSKNDGKEIIFKSGFGKDWKTYSLWRACHRTLIR